MKGSVPVNKKAVCAVLGAGASWGVISLFLRNLSGGGMDTLQIGFIRIFIAVLFFVGYALIRERSAFRIRIRDLWCFIGTGIVSIAIFNLLYFYTVIHSRVSVAVVLLYTSPIFVMILCAVIFREKITKTGITALILTVLGCCGVTGLLDGSGVSVPPLIILTGIGSGLFYALYTVFARFALKRYSSFTVTLWTFLMALIGVSITGKPVSTFILLNESPSLILWALGLGLISTALPYFLYTWGLQYMESGKAAVIVAIEPVVGTLMGTFFFHESLTVLMVLGVTLILVSIVLLNLKRRD